MHGSVMICTSEGPEGLIRVDLGGYGWIHRGYSGVCEREKADLRFTAALSTSTEIFHVGHVLLSLLRFEI